MNVQELINDKEKFNEVAQKLFEQYDLSNL